jgi:hypothetical protein
MSLNRLIASSSPPHLIERFFLSAAWRIDPRLYSGFVPASALRTAQ